MLVLYRSNKTLEETKLFLTDVEDATLYLFGNGSLNVLEKYSSKYNIILSVIFKKNTNFFNLNNIKCLK